MATTPDLNMQVAVHQSLEDQLPPTEQTAKELPPARLTIDDMISKMLSWEEKDVPMVCDSEGDTLIFIDAASRQPEQDATDYDYYQKRCAKPMRMKREALMRLNSSVINKAFGPTPQYRELRRRNLVDKLPLGIKYVIDLTPPNEGEDAVWLLTSLSCSEGVRLWYHSHKIWNVSKEMVCGVEEYTSVKRPKSEPSSVNPLYLTRGTYASAQISSLPQQGSSEAGRGALSAEYSPVALSAEYSPVRHRAAIERVLAAAQGADPKFDSAPKVWTTFAVTKRLNIVNSLLADYFVTWLRASPNSVFLEVLTEASHSMSDHLEVYDLERDTFAMLVGEEALDSLHRSKRPELSHKFSTFGRKKEDLPEHIQTRVEYASKKFIDRVNFDFEQLKSVNWIASLPEVQKLLSYTQPELQTHVSTLMRMLHDWMQGTLLHVLCSDSYADAPYPEVISHGGEVLVPRYERKAVFNVLTQEERILTRTFWKALKSLSLFDGESSLGVTQGWRGTAGRAAIPAEPTVEDAGFCRIQKSDLKAVIEVGQDRLMKLDSHEQQKKGSAETTSTAPLPSMAAQSSSSSPRDIAKRVDSMPIRVKFANDAKPALTGAVDGTSPNTQISPNLNAIVDAWSNSMEKDVDEWEKMSIGDPLSDWDDTRPLLREYYPSISVLRDQGPSSLPLPKLPSFFDLSKFFYEAEDHLVLVASNKLAYTDQLTRKEPYELTVLNTLVSLEDTEWQYLPLWAGGNDDGTGGVFQEDVPIPDVSFATAGPVIRHGAAKHTLSECDTLSVASDAHRNTNTSSSSAPSSAYHMVNGAGSIIPSSNLTNAGSISTQLHHGHVYAADSIDGASDTGDDFSVIARSESLSLADEEAYARKQIEAMELAETAEAEAAAEKQKKMESLAADDEDYADVFGGADSDGEEQEGRESDDTMKGEFDDCGSEGEMI